MEILNTMYNNLFTVCSLIPVLFMFSMGINFLTINNKSKATLHLGLSFMIFFLFFMGNFLGALFYHPLAAYHRFLTVGFVLPVTIHLNQFVFFFHEDRNPRVRKIFFWSMYIFAFLAVGYCLHEFYFALKVFNFTGHYWDFDLDHVSKMFGLIIIIYEFIFTGVGIWKTVVIKSKVRWALLAIVIVMTIAILIPSLLNAMSRDGRIDRGTYLMSHVVFIIIGFFTMGVIYLNNTTDQTNFLTKVLGISLATILIVFEFLSIFVLQDIEKSYDALKNKDILIMINSSIHPQDLEYMAVFSTEKKSIKMQIINNQTTRGINFDDVKNEFLNTEIYERIIDIPAKDFLTDVKPVLSGSDSYFAGYRDTILDIIEKKSFLSKNPSFEVLETVKSLNRPIQYLRFKIKEIPDNDFRNQVINFIIKADPRLKGFKKAILNYISESSFQGGELKNNVLKFLTPFNESGVRNYRTSSNGDHYTAFMYADINKKVIYEAGFSYLSYRRFIHPIATKFIYILGAMMLVIIIGFQFFFLGAFVSPLKKLLKGMQQVSEGNLGVIVPVAVKDELGYITQNFNIMVSDLKSSRDGIIQSEKKYRELSDMLPDIIFETNIDLNISYLNRFGFIQTGYNEDDINKGLPIRKLLYDEDFKLIYDLIHGNVKATGGKISMTHKIIKKDSGFFFGENSTVLIYDDSGKPIGLRGIIRDVTDKLVLQENLVQAQKMETIGTLAGGIAHDFNNLLGGIIGTISVMKYELDDKKKLDPDDLYKYLEIMEESSQRASDLVQQLLTLAQKKETSHVAVDLALTVKHILKICNNTFDKSIEIQTELPQGQISVYADPTQVEQVLLNLCVNANHAMTIMRSENEKKGGKIHITIQKIFGDKHFCASHPEAKEINYWILSVGDSGVGMDMKTMSKIYVPFFTTKEKGKGTGLGLSMVYNIVQQHNGFIDVYSEVGIGTTFNVYLPVLARDDLDNKKKDEIVFPKGEGLILIVDDEEIIRLTASLMLEKCGYRVITATDGLNGIDVFNERHNEITAVLIDLIMPKMSGEQSYLEMRKIDPKIKVILASGYKQDERVNIALKSGINVFIQKPYTLEKLAQAMYDLIFR